MAIITNQFMKRIYLSLLACCFAFSLSAQQHIAPLNEAAWNSSEWISAKDAPVITGKLNEDTRSAGGASWFTAQIKNPQAVAKAIWMTTSLGVNELYVNGQRVGKEILRPGFSHFAKTKYSFTYDITALFHTKKGAKNALAAQVTPGWWADKVITPTGLDGFWGKKCAFRGVVQLTFTDGSTQLYGTRTDTWKAGIAGRVKHAAIFDGEKYDAREKIGYAAKLDRPEVNTEFKGIIKPINGAEIYLREDLSLQPQRSYIYNKVEGATTDAHGKVVIDREYQQGQTIVLHAGEHLVIDFGQNCAAVPRFEFHAAKGTTLTCRPGELLNDGNGAKKRGMDGPEGSVHRRNLRIADKSIRMDYIFAGLSSEQYQPRYTFFGYRFLDITSTGDVTINRIQSIPVSSISQSMEIGQISTGNALVNRLIQNTLWGQRSNYLSVPTDCPQRNERLGWTADTQVFSETGTYFANTDRFFHKWTHDLRDTQNEQGGYPGVAPYGQNGSTSQEYMRVGWADAGIIVPWTVWKQFADRSIVDENWEAMERYMDHVNQTKYDHNALKNENGNFQWGDWLSYEPLESYGGGTFNKDGVLMPEALEYWCYLSASYWAIDAAMMRDMAHATGRDSKKYEQMVADAKAYLKERFLTPEGMFKIEILNTMQTPALFALRNHLVEGEARNKMIARLRQNFEAHGGCLQTGFLGTSILMKTLTDNGMIDVAYNLLFQHKNPSWLYSVDNGATTIWERWNSYMKEKGMGPKGMNSFNHYAYGCVCQWIWQTCAGIAADPTQPGFKHIIMRPVPDRRLGHLDASYQSASGLIKSSWRYEGNQWIWTFTIPQGATASVTLLGDTTTTEYQAGTYIVKR